MRNNQDRLGVTQDTNESISPSVMQSAGGDFSFIATNDIVELPSKGLYYPEGHPLRDNPAIELKQMTAKEEDILTNQSYIKQGVVVERLLHSLLVDKSLDLDDLLIGDKNALLVQIRVSAYGADYPVQTLCRSCLSTQDVTFDLDECVSYREASFDEEVQQNDDGTFTITMPKSKATVQLRFITSNDEKELVKKEEKYKKHDVEFSNVIEAYRQMMISVNGDPDLVGKYLDNMPLQDSRYLKKIIKTVPPAVDMNGSFECEKCGADNEQEVPITYRFFWPDL